jgi:hypothetical protein
MDESALPSSLPSAAELGISEAEYERILRDVRRRHGVVEPPAVPTPGRRRRGWARWAVLAVVAVLAIPLVPGRDPGPEHAFLQTVGGEPVAYTSCRQIRVAVYPAGGPADAEQLVRDAVAQVRRATGLDIVVTGSFGGNAPNWDFEAGPVHPDDPISVSWQDGDAIAELTDHTAGLGGSRVLETPGGTRRLVAGTIALSRDYYDTLGDRSEGLAVLLHEFGHVLGLDHVSSRRELMHPVVSGDLTSYGPGDLEGLRALGRGPC